ncbi:GNAT family N-acetyltransferase [Desertihabitans aurantiacus]|uniref:GNAT family N-acetyltransferase n=1 Tax=Desertihabitans aurantiacus TaxID=2282477 RepID=UPI000DF811BE|nr:GNAT family protein [Desertihabitans aurantiacus]
MRWTRQLTEDVVLRPVTLEDAAALATAYADSWLHLAPWEPERPASWFTADGQRREVEAHQRATGEGAGLWLVLVEQTTVVGRVSLTGIVRRAFQSANLGYWTAATHTGRGLMTRAVDAAAAIARDELGLHRLQAGTLLHNTASQRVLRRCGFTEIGVAERYLRIGGRWQDHRLFQRILHD